MKRNFIFNWIGVIFVLILFGNCQSKDEDNLLPEAYFVVSDTIIRVGQSVSFINLSIHSINSCLWDFGDGGISTSQNPSHTFSTDGTYTVSLTASNSYGSDTETKINCIRVVGNSIIFNPIIFNPNLTYGTVTDIDGNSYKTIQIGTQTWMAQNLKTTKYNDGSDIPMVDWGHTSYDYHTITTAYATVLDTSNGAYYNWYTVNTAKLAPSGWHVPTQTEWTTLIDYLGGANVAGGKLKEAGLAHWDEPNEGASNESGFTALPHGLIYYMPYIIGYGLGTGSWWSATTIDDPSAMYFKLTPSSRQAYTACDYKGCCYSVRCVKD